MLGEGEATGNHGGSPKRSWRANRSRDLSIGAKDQSNHLVAGFLRSFPQDSWSSNKPFEAVSLGKANDWRYGGLYVLHLLSNFKSVRCPCNLNVLGLRMWAFSGPFLVSRTGDVGWTKCCVKALNYLLMSNHKRCWLILTAGRWPWKLESAKECVTTHLPNQSALKMDCTRASGLYSAMNVKNSSSLERASDEINELIERSFKYCIHE